MALCDIDLTELPASCAALTKVGGALRYYYLARRSQIATLTQAANGAVTTLTMKADKYLVKGVGRKRKNSGTAALVRNDNGSAVFDHGVKIVVPAITQDERNAAENLVGADDIVVFLPTNAGPILVYGVEEGLEVSTLTDNTGTALGDAADIELEIKGQQSKMPVLYEPTGSTTVAARLLSLDGKRSEEAIDGDTGGGGA